MGSSAQLPDELDEDEWEDLGSSVVEDNHPSLIDIPMEVVTPSDQRPRRASASRKNTNSVVSKRDGSVWGLIGRSFVKHWSRAQLSKSSFVALVLGIPCTLCLLQRCLWPERYVLLIPLIVLSALVAFASKSHVVLTLSFVPTLVQVRTFYVVATTANNLWMSGALMAMLLLLQWKHQKTEIPAHFMILLQVLIIFAMNYQGYLWCGSLLIWLGLQDQEWSTPKALRRALEDNSEESMLFLLEWAVKSYRLQQQQNIEKAVSPPSKRQPLAKPAVSTRSASEESSTAKTLPVLTREKEIPVMAKTEPSMETSNQKFVPRKLTRTQSTAGMLLAVDESARPLVDVLKRTMNEISPDPQLATYAVQLRQYPATMAILGVAAFHEYVFALVLIPLVVWEWRKSSRLEITGNDGMAILLKNNPKWRNLRQSVEKLETGLTASRYLRISLTAWEWARRVGQMSQTCNPKDRQEVKQKKNRVSVFTDSETSFQIGEANDDDGDHESVVSSQSYPRGSVKPTLGSSVSKVGDKDVQHNTKISGHLPDERRFEGSEGNVDVGTKNGRDGGCLVDKSVANVDGKSPMSSISTGLAVLGVTAIKLLFVTEKDASEDSPLESSSDDRRRWVAHTRQGPATGNNGDGGNLDSLVLNLALLGTTVLEAFSSDRQLASTKVDCQIETSGCELPHPVDTSSKRGAYTEVTPSLGPGSRGRNESSIPLTETYTVDDDDDDDDDFEPLDCESNTEMGDDVSKTSTAKYSIQTNTDKLGFQESIDTTIKASGMIDEPIQAKQSQTRIIPDPPLSDSDDESYEPIPGALGPVTMTKTVEDIDHQVMATTLVSTCRRAGGEQLAASNEEQPDEDGSNDGGSANNLWLGLAVVGAAVSGLSVALSRRGGDGDKQDKKTRDKQKNE